MRFDAPVLLYGAGKEARSTRAFLKAQQPELEVFVTVDNGVADIADAKAIAPADLEQAIAGRRFGTIVKSPGVSLYKPIFETARNAGIAITSNLNLWGATYRHGRTAVAITGTKGKSTTATLTHLMLTRSGIDAGLAGNVGLAPLDIADTHAVVVLELSSYQTADMNFLPDIAAITNLYPEHVDWHGSVERYYADKLHRLLLALRRAAMRWSPRRCAIIAASCVILPPRSSAPSKMLPPSPACAVPIISTIPCWLPRSPWVQVQRLRASSTGSPPSVPCRIAWKNMFSVA